MFPPVPSDFRIPEMRFVDIPITINGERSLKRLMPPLLGEHTDEVLKSLDYSDEEIAAMRRDKVTK